MSCVRVVAAALIALAIALPAGAQEASSWGFSGSFTPRWEFLQFLEDAMEREIDMQGVDLSVGIIRGKRHGGEWGVSFVRRAIEDDSIVIQQETAKCLARSGLADVCARGTFHLTRGASLTGAQAHRFFPIGTIGSRVQIGAVLSGGVARIRGDAEEVQEHLQVHVNPNGTSTLSVGSVSSIVPARQIFDDSNIDEIVPIGGAEAAVAVIVAPGVKLRFSGGASFPGFHVFSVTMQYLIR